MDRVRSRVNMDSDGEDDHMMEISEENQQLTVPRKRNADEIEEVDDAGSSGESRDGEDIDGDSDVSSRAGFQEWDEDSFEDGHVYNPTKKIEPDDEEAQKMRRYRIQMYESNGFNVDIENYSGRVAFRELYPINLDEPFRNGLTGRAYMQNNVDVTVNKYNKINGLSLACACIVRAVICTISCSLKSYITFMARETPDGDLVEYQAKTEKMPWQKRDHALFCRPTPKPKVIHVPRYEDCISTDSSTDSNASSRGSDQEWDVDSFDDDESEYQPPIMLCPSEEEVQLMRLYRPKMYPSKGFHVDGETYPGKSIFFSKVDLDVRFYGTGLTGREHMQNLVDSALEKYNNIKETSVTCESIVRANLTRVNGYKLYITFTARESPAEELVEYQVKTERKVWQGKYHAMFCRATPTSKDFL
ncbi:unnamed protein product [Eruca vesicaria subsp. sativa]|uniref:Cystatin domain-containing protein n=1 Tax=Eruca vesicaria subsp. sativa TaxID=29727 RepID=A0ABC8KCB5_ERUVS|nr:unnamed protein product [Eruca vesicaria subsp. sativa]